MRAALGLEELLELLVRTGHLQPELCKDLAAREKKLRSQVLKDRVGSVRCHAPRIEPDSTHPSLV